MGERILREEGFEVVTVTDGATVLHRLDDVQPDVLLLDAFMPDKSGFALCRELRTRAGYETAGIVLVAGLLEPVDEIEARNAGADAVLKKPFEASAVLETVRSLLEKVRVRRGGEPEAAAEPETPAEPEAPAESEAAAQSEAPDESEAAAQPEASVEEPAPAEAEAPPAPPVALAEVVLQTEAAVAEEPVAASQQPEESEPEMEPEAPPAESEFSEPVESPVAVELDASPEIERAAKSARVEVGISVGEFSEAAVQSEPASANGSVDPERVRAAVTVALHLAMPALIDEVTAKVLVALGEEKPEERD